jgi:hypothetical protein
VTYPALLDIARGISRGLSPLRQSGQCSTVADVYTPITGLGIYRTPQAASQLRVAAGDASNSPTGAGARSVQIWGLDAAGDEQTEVLVCAGTSAGELSLHSYLRLYRAEVFASGTYATQTAASHTAELRIETAAGEDWALIENATKSQGRAQFGVYSVPRNQRLFITDFTLAADLDKKIDIALYKREDLLQTAAPYSPLLVLEEFSGFTGSREFEFRQPLGPFPPLTDIGFMAVSSAGTAAVSASFDGILERVL